MEFKPGDVVELKSGGPYMTVKNTDSDSVICVWFNNEGGNWTIHTGAFVPSTLKKT